MSTALTVPARARLGRRTRGLVLLGLLVCSFALLLALTPRAEAFIYWTNQTGYSIGRANNNATGVNQNFITGLGRVFDVYVDEWHIWWTGYHSIGRASLDGTNVNNSFITGITPTGLTIYDHHVYWSDYSGYIGRAATDGTGIDRTWINCKAISWNVTQHLGYFYWNWEDSSGNDYIARDNPSADGGTVSHTDILGGYWIHFPSGMCATASHLWWRTDDALGRASTPYGLDPDRTYITGLEGYGSGLAEYNDYLYYTTTGFLEGPANIGRVKNDGSGLNNAYITGCSTPSGVYVDGGSAATSVAALADQIDAAELTAGRLPSLVKKLTNAKAALERGNVKAALNIVDATINEIEAQAGKKIPADTAARWISALTLIRVHIV